jgi:hypothetical protein
MASIKELHYAFDLGMDRFGTLSKENFNKAEKDWLLNEAQMIFLKRRTSIKNNRNEGFEASQKRIDDLSTLVIKYPLQPGLVPTLNSNMYIIDLTDLVYTYYQLIDAYVDTILSENCVKSVPLKLIQHDDIRTVLRDPFNNASLEAIPYNFGRSATGGSSIYIYPDKYKIALVYIEYIKLPSKVNYGNYVYINGTTYPETTLEFPEHTHSEIVDIACQIAALNIESPEYIQMKSQKVFEHE